MISSKTLDSTIIVEDLRKSGTTVSVLMTQLILNMVLCSLVPGPAKFFCTVKQQPAVMLEVQSSGLLGYSQ